MLHFKKITQGVVFLAGRVSVLLTQASEPSLYSSVFTLEIGSSFGMHRHQEWNFLRFGADGESRTPISTLGRSHNSRYTTPALDKIITPLPDGDNFSTIR